MVGVKRIVLSGKEIISRIREMNSLGVAKSEFNHVPDLEHDAAQVNVGTTARGI
jgi:hypothetical protein